MNSAEGTNQKKDAESFRISPSKMSAASASGASVAGLHGGNFYDLTRDDNLGLVGRHRRHGAVMDHLRVCSGTSSSIATTNLNNPKQCNPFIIDLVNDSDGSDAEDGVRKKRSLQRNKCGKMGPSPNSSPMRQKRTRRPLNGDALRMNPHDRLNCHFNIPPAKTRDGALVTRRPLNGALQMHPRDVPKCHLNIPPYKNRDGAVTRRPLNGALQVHPRDIPKCHLNLPSCKTRDGATITFGILSLIDVLKDESILTCEGSISSSKGKLYSPIKSPSTMNALPFNHQPYHALQNDNWSCGFRNLQMLISSMLPRLSSIFREGVPCIAQIQRDMETLWGQGFDRTNAEHHGHSLLGKKTWIGTVEVWSYLSFNRIDSIIVQFIKTKENRGMLGHFVWAYFSRTCGSLGCGCNDIDSFRNPLASPTVHSYQYAAHLLRGFSEPCRENLSGRVDQIRRCTCSLPPLYLQWEGHSVTVVGVRKNSNANGQSPSYNLITFCPQKQQLPGLKYKLMAELSTRDSAKGMSLNSELSENFLNEKFVKSIIELPASKLQNKDCQILLSTAHIIDEAESHRRKSCTKNVGFVDAIASTK